MNLHFLPQVFADSFIGTIPNPLSKSYGNVDQGLTLLISNILRFAFVIGGIIAFINFILAGFEYMSAAGDAKKVTAAGQRITNSMVGLVVMVGSFALTALISYLIFGKADFILNPIIYGPK